MWTSIHNLIFIALERHIAVIYPMRYKKVKVKHVALGLVFIYVLDFVLMLPNAQLVR